MPTITETPMVNIYEAKTQLSKLVDLAASGTDVVIARAGKPMARLTMLKTDKEKRIAGLGSLEGKGWIAEDFDALCPMRFWRSSRGDNASTFGHSYLLLVVFRVCADHSLAFKTISEAEVVFVSSASIWEISIKARLGKIDADPQRLFDQMIVYGFRELPVWSKHAMLGAKLPMHHAIPLIAC